MGMIGTSALLAWGISAVHVIIFLAVVLLLFGGKKLPELARGLGKGMRIFRDEIHGITKDIDDPMSQPAKREQAASIEPTAVNEKK